MKNIVNKILFLTFLIIFSCSSGTDIQENNHSENEILIEDDILTEAMISDTFKKKHEIKEQQENLAKIEKRYGEQWGFCECVVANDSIDKAVKKITDFETPETEKLLERFDHVSKKCQAFLGMDSSRTPEEREKHEKKVKKCLKDAKKN